MSVGRRPSQDAEVTVAEETSTSQAAAAATAADGDGRVAEPSSLVSFSDLARAHYRWDVAAKGSDRDRARDDFNDKLVRFEERFGVDVTEAYWCQKQASAVALAETRPGRPGLLRRLAHRVLRRPEPPDFRLYRVTDWVTGDVRKIADLLHECDVLAIKATWGLEGIQRAVVMQWLLAVETYLLGFIESEWKRPPPRDPVVGDSLSAADAGKAADRAERKRDQAKKRAQQEAAARLDRVYLRALRELSKIEDYYQQAGQKRARLRYVEGMLVLGVPAVAATAIVSAVILDVFGLLDLESAGVRRFYASMAAGAIGAIISVLMRMSDRRGGFTIDHELGSVGVRRLGAFRPLIGAVSGVVLSLLVQTSLGPTDQNSLSMEFYVVVGFLAGFSERWTKVVLEGAMRTIEKVDDAPEKPRRTRPVANSSTHETSGQ